MIEIKRSTMEPAPNLLGYTEECFIQARRLDFETGRTTFSVRIIDGDKRICGLAANKKTANEAYNDILRKIDEMASCMRNTVAQLFEGLEKRE